MKEFQTLERASGNLQVSIDRAAEYFNVTLGKLGKAVSDYQRALIRTMPNLHSLEETVKRIADLSIKIDPMNLNGEGGAQK